MKRWITIGILAALCLVMLVVVGITSDELDSATARLDSMQAELDSLKSELALTQDELGTRKGELTDLQVSYDGLVAGHGYTMKDPTYKEMMDFIRKDKTDSKQYVEGEYICEDFAMDVCNNADEEGIRCAYVTIHYPDGGHAIVAFNTIDRGLIYIEPQSDELVNPVVGKHYYKCVIPEPGYYHEEPAYDDTIEKILVIW
jgi:hypothetical protein